jgi:sn-glycerol 3-phosphate transport system permease protein
MIENRPLATFVAHMTLVIGVIIIGLPLYLTFIASTHTAEAIVQNVPMPLLPGDNFVESYRLALFGARRPPAARCHRPARCCSSA